MKTFRTFRHSVNKKTVISNDMMEYSPTAWRGQSSGLASANWRRTKEGLDDNERTTDWLWLPLCLQESASAWMVTWGTRFTSTSAFAASGAPTRGELRQPGILTAVQPGRGNVWRIIYSKEEARSNENDVWSAITWKRSLAIMSSVLNILLHYWAVALYEPLNAASKTQVLWILALIIF